MTKYIQFFSFKVYLFYSRTCSECSNAFCARHFLLRDLSNGVDESGYLLHRHEPRDHVVLYSLAMGSWNYWPVVSDVYDAISNYTPLQKGID